jgi:hypothetical protein
VEIGDGASLKGDDEVVHELLGRDVTHRTVGLALLHIATYGVQQVCLAEPGAAVDEEWVVRVRGRFGDGKRGRMGKAIGRSDHE